MPEVIDQSPSPKSHIKTLMRIGYDFNSAIADVIDNSISANAKCIEVYSPPPEGEPFIRILDDGIGMDRDELIQNMRIGCKDPHDIRHAGDLGRFGSGMKTASFSQARRLTVVTKKKGKKATAARWDIDAIEDQDKWCLDIFDADEIKDLNYVDHKRLKSSGTQLIWEKLTCLGEQQSQQRELAEKLAGLKEYLSLHFHRFMTGKRKRKLFVNRDLLDPMDPFMVNARGYQEGPGEKIKCGDAYVHLQTHVLPHFNKISAQNLKRYGGTATITQNQGLYIYREKRLINAGGWLGLTRHSQLGALARVQVDIPSSFDNEWETDVKKASLQIPPSVKRTIRRFLSDPVKRSVRVYRYRGKQEKTENIFWDICEDENNKTITYQINTENSLLLELTGSLDKSQTRSLSQYLKSLHVNLPIHHIYEKMSSRPKDIDLNESANSFSEAFERYLESLEK